MVFWSGKRWFIGLTVLLAIGAAVFTVQTPNIYESKAVLVVDAEPYGFDVEHGESFVNNQQAFVITSRIIE